MKYFGRKSNLPFELSISSSKITF